MSTNTNTSADAAPQDERAQVEQIMALADDYASAEGAAVGAFSSKDADTSAERTALLNAIRAALPAQAVARIPFAGFDPNFCPGSNPENPQTEDVATVGDEPVAWMHPETLDVIHADRKRGWETHFGAGGAKRAEGYTVPLGRAAPAQDVAPTDAREVMRFNIYPGGIINPDPRGMYVRYEDHAAALAAQPAAQPADALPAKWANGCDRTVPAALRYLADHERPSGGEDCYNAAHLFQLADEIEGMARRGLYASPRPAAQPAAQPADVPTPADVTALARVSEDFEGSCSTDESHATLMRLANLGLLECSDFHVTAAGRATLLSRSKGNAS